MSLPRPGVRAPVHAEIAQFGEGFRTIDIDCDDVAISLGMQDDP